MKLNNQPIIIDFYVDWCISCKQDGEQFTFANPRVQKALQPFRLLRADVTRTNNLEN
ncbi:thioredoxin family protein [Candidatus Coxiella mudrowiae]|uniref:thioredoxin family protein n=1 Tax=Candidatus Coxiella mudrowiae TaxID=2054173 RepID=UPI00352D2589